MTIFPGAGPRSGAEATSGKKNKKRRKRLVFVLVLVAAAVLILAVCLLRPSGWLARRSLLSLRAAVLQAEPGDFWRIFDLDDSVGFLAADEGEVFREEALEEKTFASPAEADAFLSALLPVFRRKVRADAPRYLRQAQLFWSGVDDFLVDFVEDYEENPFASKVIGVVVVSPRRFEFDVYRGRSGSFIFPLPRSAYQKALADALAEKGLKAAAWRRLMEAALDEARFAELEPSILERLADFPDDLRGEDWRGDLAALLDTVHDEATLAAFGKLCRAAADKKFIDNTLADALMQEAEAIRKFNAGDYREALAAFNRNLSYGFPGTPYYISLCALRLGERNYPGSFMRELFEDLRYEGGKKKGRE